MLVGEPFAGTTKAGHHFIGNPFDAVLIAERANAF